MARVRWGNVGRLAALLAAALMIVAGPRWRDEPRAPAPPPVAARPPGPAVQPRAPGAPPLPPPPTPTATTGTERGVRDRDDRDERRGGGRRDSRVGARSAADAG